MERALALAHECQPLAIGAPAVEVTGRGRRHQAHAGANGFGQVDLRLVRGRAGRGKRQPITVAGQVVIVVAQVAARTEIDLLGLGLAGALQRQPVQVALGVDQKKLAVARPVGCFDHLVGLIYHASGAGGEVVNGNLAAKVRGGRVWWWVTHDGMSLLVELYIAEDGGFEDACIVRTYAESDIDIPGQVHLLWSGGRPGFAGLACIGDEGIAAALNADVEGSVHGRPNLLSPGAGCRTELQ